jgi:hypothetical protein
MLTVDWSLHTLRRNIHTVKHGEKGANLLRELRCWRVPHGRER